MDWDLGLRGLALLAAMSGGFGAVVAVFVGGSVTHRLWWLAVTAVACFGVGLFTSEVWFGWATEEDLQPNIDGLSFDEVLLAGVATSILLLVLARWLARRRS